MFSNKDLRRLIVPLIIEQLLAATIGLADTVMVSSCGEAAVSGISLVDSVNFLLITLFSALATGGSVIAAQYIGKGDKQEASNSANQLLYSSLGLALLLMLVSIVFRNQALRLIFGKIEADVMANAQIYFLISAISYPFLAVYNSGAALFRAMGDSKTSMYTSVLMNTINVSGNALLIYGFKLGVVGAASATLFSRVVGAVLITILLLNQNRTICYRNLLNVRFNFGLIKKILYIGVPNGIENSIFQIGKILVASIVSGLGTSSITANAVAGNLAGLQVIPGMAIGMAMITVVGQCVGARDYVSAKKNVKKLMLICYCVVLAMTIFMALTLDIILGFYGLSPETAELTKKAFIIHGVFAIFIWPMAFALPNALRAANDVKFTMYASLISMWTCRIALSYVFVHLFHMDVLGIWLAMCIDWVVRAAFFVPRYLRGKWTKKQII